MERCPSCGAELPAVAYFCPICGVKLEEAAAATPPPNKSEKEIPHTPHSDPVPAPSGKSAGTDPIGGRNGAELRTPHSEVPPAPPGWRVAPVSGPEMLGPAFWAGIAGGVLVGVPGTSNCACLWMLGCGALAVFFFHKQFGRAALPNEAGRLGALSGFFGFLVAFLVAFLSHALIRRNPLGLVDHLRENLERSAQMVKPEESARILEVIHSPGSGAVLLAVLATVYLFTFLTLGTLGALLSGALARRR